MRKIFLFLSIYVILISWGTSQSIDQATKKYFLSGDYKRCDNVWKKYRVGYESTIATELKGGYGHQTMNVYIARNKDALLLSIGYHHSDNQVELLYQDILLEEFPTLLNPEISFDLCGNGLSIDSSLSKMIIHADYYLFRNKSDIIYSLEDQNSLKSSPFRFQQVQNTGQIAITAEGCSLTGTVFTKLDGNTVNLGVDMFRLRHCRFNVDVFTPGQKSPPVLANYLFDDTGPNEKNILVQTLSKEIMLQLQAALVAHVNTSAIFEKDLLSIERQQKLIIAQVESYLDDVLRRLNMRTMDNKMETINLENFNIKWNDAFDGTETDCEISLKDVTMSGLDTVYSTHIGGPMKLGGLLSIAIAERYRLSNVQVLGKLGLRGMYEGEYDFAADIYDLNIDMALNPQTIEKKQKGIEKGIIVGEWSTLEFSCPGIEELPIEAIVTGYLIKKIPKHLLSYIISSVYNHKTSNNGEDETNEKLTQPESGVNANSTLAKNVTQPESGVNANSTLAKNVTQPESGENASATLAKNLTQPESGETKNELTQTESDEKKNELTQLDSGENKNATNDAKLTQPESGENKTATYKKRYY